MNRSQAKALGHSTYDTGKPCKHGHFSYRYTSNGTCAACINPGTKEKTIDPGEQQRRATLQTFERMRFRAWDDLIGKFRQAVYAAAIMRCPYIKPEDLNPGLQSTARCNGNGLYSVLCHPDDYQMLLEVSNGLMRSKGPPDFSHIHRNLAQINKELDNPEDWPQHPPR